MNDLNLLVDSAWYRDRYPEATTTGMSPREHYFAVGAAQGLDPHPLFDTSFYLERYPDIVAAGINPLEHFVNLGGAEGRHPHVFFDSAWYLERYPDVAGAGINPLIDYLRADAASDREPNSQFNTRTYVERHPELAAQGINPLVHYVAVRAVGAREARRRIQVHRGFGIGDVLLVTPVLAALRRKYPGDEIIVTSDYPELLRYNPHIDALVKLRMPQRLPDVDEMLDLEYETRPDDHIVDAYARGAGVSVADRTPQIYLTQLERSAANEFLRRNEIRAYERFCVMHMNTGWAVRDWPIDRFRKVVRKLQSDGLRVAILGERAEPPIDFGVDLRGKTSIRMAAAIIEKCAVMVTIDSSLMHIAYAFRRPVVSLFGCTDPEKRVPDWGLPSTLYSGISCRGCHHRQRPLPATQAPKCLWESVRCMERLLTSSVISLVRTEVERADRPVVSIVIPHYFRYDTLHACLSSIFACGARLPFEVIVVADGSPDDSLQRLEAWRPRVRTVKLRPNRGFSQACNAGVWAARGKYAVVLNDDTTVTPGWIDELVAYLQSDPAIGITGPKLLYPQNDQIQHCGTVINERGIGEHIYRFRPADFTAADKPRFYRALTGACLVMERDLFLRLGGFDATFHGSGGCEDTDLCFKVLECGRQVAYCPRSTVYHHEGLTRGLRDAYQPEDVHNRGLLRDRWSEYLTPDIADYHLLAAIEAGEGQSWRWLREVPAEFVVRYSAERCG